MHEYSIVQALVERVAAEAQARCAVSVGRIHVALGELSGVDPDLLASAYALFRERTVCDGAEMILRRVPVRWSCPRCGDPIAPGAVLQCPACGVPARLVAGDEIVLERIEMEVDDV